METQKHTAKTREPWLDWLRAIAILWVIFAHAIEGFYVLDAQHMQTLGLAHRTFVVLGHLLARSTSVTIFLMLSGYFFLDREYDTKAVGNFLKKHWLHLIICTEIWLVAYEVFLLLYQGQPIPLGYMIRVMLFLEPSSMYHMWYMPVIIGLYACVPFVANALKKIDVSALKIPMIFYFCYIFGVELYGNFSNVFGISPIVNQVPIGFSGGAYGFYLILGYMIKKGAFKKIKTVVFVCGAVLSVALSLGFQLYAFQIGSSFGEWLDSPFLLIYATCCFELASRFKEHLKYNKLIYVISYYSFAIYLVHNVARAVLMKPFLEMDMIVPVKTVLLGIAMFGCSLLFIVLVSKIPKVGKYVFYIKN